MTLGPENLLPLAGILVGSAFFSGSETALFSLRPEEYTPSRRDSLAWCLERARPVLLTILLANLFLNTSYFALAASIAADLGPGLGLPLTAGAFLALIVFGEILPKALALGLRARLAPAVAPVLRACTIAIAPIRVPIQRLMDVLAARFGAPPAGERHELSPKEIQEYVQRHPERFGLERRAADLVAELMSWAEFQVRDLMRPYVDQKPLQAGATVAEAWRAALSSGEEWLPVEDARGCIGLLDLRSLPGADPRTPVAELCRKTPAVPETARLHHLVDEMKRKDSDQFLVVDEYGHVVGTIGWKELVSDAVGDLVRAERERHAAPVRLRSGRGWEVDGSLNLRAFAEIFDLDLPAARSRTLGGWIIERLGRIPNGGECVEHEGRRFEVLGVQRGRVVKVLVRLPERGRDAETEERG